ncbi:MAG TPA: hypothetical protein PKL55_09700, partial [Syntrophales bacterium]|nr:hypothetical protein [Syntrophales bacterium]
MSKDYYEVVVEGHPEYVNGFVHGLIAGRGGAGDAFFGEDFEIDEERPLEILSRLVGLREEHTVLLVEETVLGLLKEVIGGGRREGGMKLISTRKIREASFKYSFATFSRETGAALDKLL